MQYSANKTKIIHFIHIQWQNNHQSKHKDTQEIFKHQSSQRSLVRNKYYRVKFTEPKNGYLLLER